MPYRVNANELSMEHASGEARELEDVARDARRRQRRSALVIVTVLVGGWALAAIAVAQPGRPQTSCHRVERRYENAPQLPPETWTACEQR
jgi:hypothetical protein